ncbi:MAG: hypothetical protein FWD30_03785 [Dehalococcoidia bacterium]|nr:hypothetical protein [Dehalococcoidia bacterium]
MAASSPETAAAFEAELKRLRITVTLRKSLGRDIKAACGQLKSSRQQYGIDALTGVS